MRNFDGGLARLGAYPRYSLCAWPTPVERHELRNGPAIWVKRDDLSGWGRGGAKARKVEHLLGHLLAHGYTDLVTVAGNVTNLAFDLLPALDRAGIAGHLHIIDDPPVTAAERAQIFSGIAERVTLLGPSRREAFRRTWQRWFELRRQGRKPLWVMPGVSHPAGILGNAAGYLELVEQLELAGHALPTTVFITAATGTTVAGFLMAERLRRQRGGRPIRIVGVQIYEGRTRAATRWLMRWASLSTGQRLPFAPPVEIASDALSGGFGRFTPELAELCERVQSETGLLIDPIFGGKTWASMERESARRKPRDGEFLYWHCGYTPEWRTLGKMVNAT
ncbi:MAG TPA: pyridoxal-phosphate dependent enzyme [Polyangiaceae bacterium]|nr:pyridoxal-phosphate dependent enzyme [Polyangiaceae bacterium]